MKELRLREICLLEAANSYASEFMADYNERFAQEPLSPHDAHRPVRDDEDLGRIFTWQEERKISQELTIHYRSGQYLIDPSPETMRLRGRMCRGYADAVGRVEILHEGRSLSFRAFDELRRVTQADIVSNKRLSAVLTQIQADQRVRDQGHLAEVYFG